MRQQELRLAGPLGPLELIKHIPGEAFAASDRLRWVGLEAVRYREQPPNEIVVPPLTHHWLLLILRAPKELEVRSEGISRFVPPPAGSILVLPAGRPAWWRWSGGFDWLHVFLEPGLVERVAAEAFGLDPARLSLPPLDSPHLPDLRAAMMAVGAELTAGAAGGRLAAESLANVLAVHLIRHVLAPRRPEGGLDGALPQRRLRAVVEYVEEHLACELSLERLAAVARLSPCHFARQFKAATGLPPHQYVIMRRVERARQLLQATSDLPLAEVALDAGFSDQSTFSRHFKRIVGVSPGQFLKSARIT